MSLSKIEMFISNIGISFLHERDTPVFEVNNILILIKISALGLKCRVVNIYLK